MDTLSWEEHVVRLLAASQFKAGAPAQLIEKLALPLYQVAEEFAQSSWDVKIVNVFQSVTDTQFPRVLDEKFSTLDMQSVRDIGVSSSHSGLWSFKNTDHLTERICEQLELMVQSQYQRKCIFLKLSISLYTGVM